MKALEKAEAELRRDLRRIHEKARHRRAFIAAFEILGWLGWNQLFVYSAMDKAERERLTALNGRVREAVEAEGFSGTEAEVRKHFLLCRIELHLGEAPRRPARRGRSESAWDPPDVELDAQLAWSQARLVGEAECAAWNRKAEAIRREFKDLPVVLRHRLATRALLLEFEFAPVDFMAWMIAADLLPTIKHDRNRGKWKAQPSDIRVGLLCEFEAMRAHCNVGEETRVLLDRLRKLTDNRSRVRFEETAQARSSAAYRIVTGYDTPVSLELEDLRWGPEDLDIERFFDDHVVHTFEPDRCGEAAYLRSFLVMMSGVVTGTVAMPTLAGWAGFLGAILVELKMVRDRINRHYVHQSGRKKITYESRRATGRVSADLEKRGLELGPGALNKSWLKLEDVKALLKRYRRVMSKSRRPCHAWETDRWFREAALAVDLSTRE